MRRKKGAQIKLSQKKVEPDELKIEYKSEICDLVKEFFILKNLQSLLLHALLEKKTFIFY